MRRASLALAFLLGVACTPALSAQATTVIIVRHGEKMAESGDPDLSPAGQARAEALKSALAAFPVQGVFVTEYKRTQQTGAPSAAAAHVASIIIPARGGAKATADSIRRMPAGSAALVVGHSNTVGPIIEALGGPKLDDLCDQEYATLFVLELPAGASPRLLRLNYGAPNAPEALSCHVAPPSR
jgi:phosphohistidine phosphatase SixA